MTPSWISVTDVGQRDEERIAATKQRRWNYAHGSLTNQVGAQDRQQVILQSEPGVTIGHTIVTLSGLMWYVSTVGTTLPGNQVISWGLNAVSGIDSDPALPNEAPNTWMLWDTFVTGATFATLYMLQRLEPTDPYEPIGGWYQEPLGPWRYETHGQRMIQPGDVGFSLNVHFPLPGGGQDPLWSFSLFYAIRWLEFRPS